jgi:hypothetical protein
MSGAATTSMVQRSNVFIRMKQANAMGSAPMVSVRVKDYANIAPEDFKIITTQNDATATKMELYVKIRFEYDRIFFNPYHLEKSTTGAAATWYSDQPYSATLPAGTEAVGIQDIPFVKAYNAVSQSMTAGQFNKVAFAVEQNDYQSEYDPATSKFVANQSGIYLIKASVRMQSPSAQGRSLGVYINGVYSQRLGGINSGSIIDGFAPVRLATSDTVEIYLNTPDAVTVEGSQQDTYLEIMGTF